MIFKIILTVILFIALITEKGFAIEVTEKITLIN